MGRFQRPVDIIATEHATVTEMRKRLALVQDAYRQSVGQIENQLRALEATDPSLKAETQSVRDSFSVVF